MALPAAVQIPFETAYFRLTLATPVRRSRRFASSCLLLSQVPAAVAAVTCPACAWNHSHLYLFSSSSSFLRPPAATTYCAATASSAVMHKSLQDSFLPRQPAAANCRRCRPSSAHLASSHTHSPTLTARQELETQLHLTSTARQACRLNLI